MLIFMYGRSVLMVGSIEMTVPPHVGSELRAALRDDMTRERQVPVREYWPDLGRPREDDPLVSLREYRITGRILGERLDFMGSDAISTLAAINGAIAAVEALADLGLVVRWPGYWQDHAMRLSADDPFRYSARDR
jgi:hypothetical protein